MTETNFENRLDAVFRGHQVRNAPMSDHTTIRCGGPADWWLAPADRDSLIETVALLREEKVPLLVLGHGSNLLVRDAGWRGAVLSLKSCCGEIEVLEKSDAAIRLRVGTGLSLNRLIQQTVEWGYGGLENLAGIPASIGGAVASNAGTKEGEIGPRLEEIELLNERGNLQTLKGPKIQYSYRRMELPPRSMALSAVLKLEAGEPEALMARRESILQHRRQTQPIDQPSMGSVFKNPAKHKAGALIEEAGLKGIRLRQAMISEKHANWIVNLGGATAADVLALIRLIQDKVKDRCGVALETEIRVVGER